MIDSIKKQGQTKTLALIAKLMGLVVIFNLASCGCGKGDDKAKAKSMTITAAQKELSTKTSEEAKTQLKFTNNSDKEIDPKTAEYKVVASLAVTAKDGKDASKDAKFVVGGKEGTVGTDLKVDLKELFTDKLASKGDKSIDVVLKGFDKDTDQSAILTINVEDKDGKNVAESKVEITWKNAE